MSRRYYHTSSDQNQINIDYVMMSADSKPYPFPNGLHLFGQLVIGPPGSGKTTYCAAMHDFLVKLGRKVAVINLDPANDSLPYPCAINMADLICLDEVMDYLGLGPNGGLIYCMEYLYTNRSWLANQLAALKQKDPKIYLIFDLPGQVSQLCDVDHATKLFTLPNSLDLQLTSVHLIDSHYCSDAGKFIACVLTSLSAMLQLSIPHVNILSKADLIEQYGELDFNLDFFTEVLDLQYLIDCLHKTTNNTDQLLFNCKYTRLNQAIIDLIQDHSIVQFLLLDIQDLSHIERVMRYVDRANGYVFGTNEQHNLQSLLHSASGVELAPDWIGMIQEKYMFKKNDDNHNIDNNVQNDDEPHIDLFA
ncbi:xpa-binding protein 1-related [Schistosoma mansoni]|uniref:xpa-binding protein 1-related n=1 Tax=Schistosoma mansoni TaxID=6183 RepID=UPI0001A62D28|nr:xpa-binding protein 1-related [Schistosoma mansoni]|eukprot:XP_018652225.1 xpa-binding protein 1-related [Schistosoma mansoni]